MALRRISRKRFAFPRRTFQSLRRFRVEALEDRSLFSTTASSIILAGVPTTSSTVPLPVSLESWLGDNAVALSADTPTGEAISIADTGPFVGENISETENIRHELVFVNSDVTDYRSFLRDLTTGASQSGRVFEVVILKADQDGLAQITAELQRRRGTDLDAIHFVTHGRDGAVKFGNTWIDAAEFAVNRQRIESWRLAFSENADLLFYGCDLAGTLAGQRLLSAFYDATGADVAGSNDRTGSAQLGGDWTLEYSVGAVETGIAFSDLFQATYAGVLATTGTALWVSQSDLALNQSAWDGTSFGSASNTDNVNGQLQVIQAAQAPTRDEIILIGVDSAGQVRGEMWDGSNWTALPFNPLATLTTSSRWSAAIAYESQSGDAILVWANGTTGTEGLSYRVWNGTTWSAEQTITTPIAAENYQLRLASNPLTDELTLIVATNGPDEYALVWDGDSWGNSILLDSTGAGGQQTEVYVTYESQSGHALIVYDADAPGNTLQFRTWDGTSWSTQQTIVPSIDPGSDVRFAVLAADPNSDRIALGVISHLSETWFMVWDGSAWGSELVATTTSNSTTTLNVAVAFESQSGELLAAYGEAGAFRYRTWSSGSGWSAQQTGPDLGGGASPQTMTLSADPFSDQIMLAIHESNNHLSLANWTGTSWGTLDELETALDGAAMQPFVFVWDDTAAPVISLPGASASYTENAVPVVIDGAATVSDPDGGDFDTGTLTVDFASGGSADDRLAIRNEGSGPAQVGVSGSTVTYGGVVIGTFAGGDGLTPLAVTFNTAATATEVQAVLRNITFANVSDTPSTTDRVVQFVLADGDGGTSNVASATVTVTAVNDAPVWTVPGSQTTNEDTTLVFSAGNGNEIFVTDADADLAIVEVTITATNGTVSLSGTAGLTFSVGNGTDDTAIQFTGTISDINAALDGLEFDPTADFNGAAAIDLLVDDLGNTGSGGSQTDAASIGITVNATNDAPMLTDNTLTISEGQSVTLTNANLNTADPDNAPAQLTYSVSNLSGGQFEHTSNPGVAITSFTQAEVDAGQIVFVHDGGEAAPSYDITVSDGSLSDGPQAAAIAFTNVNDAPAIMAPSFAVLENSANGTPVASVTATDPDTGETLTFSITAASFSGAFSIDPSTGQISVTDSTLLDYETVQAITLTVTVQDAGGGSDSATVTALLQNVNEFSTSSIVDADAGLNQVAENEPANQVVGISAFADDLDLPDVVTYSLDNDAGGRFAIDPATGVVVTTDELDFETGQMYLIVARATSSDGSTATRTFTIAVADQPDVLLTTPPTGDSTRVPDSSRRDIDDEANNVFDATAPSGSSDGSAEFGGVDPERQQKEEATVKEPVRPAMAPPMVVVRPPETIVRPPEPTVILKPELPVVLPTESSAGAIAGVRVEFNEAMEKKAEQITNVRTTGVVLGTGTITLVGVGSILLQTRLGAMLLSLVSSVPMWRQFDPLSVLTAWEREKRKKKAELDQEEQSLRPILG